MQKPILSSTVAVLLLVIIPLFILNCRKTADNRGELDSKELITQANAFVAEEILTKPATLQTDNPRNDRTQSPREILWTEASVMDFHGQPAVVAPLHTSLPRTAG